MVNWHLLAVILLWHCLHAFVVIVDTYAPPENDSSEDVAASINTPDITPSAIATVKTVALTGI